MRILLADDHNLFREALALYIERAAPEAAIMTARDIHEVMEMLVAPAAVDLVLLDLFMPGMNGLEGLRKLRVARPEIPVALLSGLAEAADVAAAMELGARGYFPKTLSGKALLAGIRQILAGGQFVATDHNTDSVMPAYYGDGKIPTDSSDTAQAALRAEINLTPRERQVIDFLMRGQSNKEIASALGLQLVTVKLYVRGVCRKLGAKNRTQAALIARAHGF